MTHHNFVCQRVHDHPRSASPVDTAGGDGLVGRRDPAQRRLDSPDGDDPEHDTVIMAW
jgi:hypothetical protein